MFGGVSRTGKANLVLRDGFPLMVLLLEGGPLSWDFGFCGACRFIRTCCIGAAGSFQGKFPFGDLRVSV
jgi:hypothetical protein